MKGWWGYWLDVPQDARWHEKWRESLNDNRCASPWRRLHISPALTINECSIVLPTVPIRVTRMINTPHVNWQPRIHHHQHSITNEGPAPLHVPRIFLPAPRHPPNSPTAHGPPPTIHLEYAIDREQKSTSQSQVLQPLNQGSCPPHGVSISPPLAVILLSPFLFSCPCFYCFRLCFPFLNVFYIPFCVSLVLYN